MNIFVAEDISLNMGFYQLYFTINNCEQKKHLARDGVMSNLYNGKG